MKHLFMPTPMSTGYEDTEQMPMSPFPLNKVAAMPIGAVDYILQHADIKNFESSNILSVIWGKLDYDNTEHIAGQWATLNLLICLQKPCKRGRMNGCRTFRSASTMGDRE